MPEKPITPKEAASGSHVPDIVIETVNDYLKSYGSAQRIVLKQDELVNALIEKGLSRSEIFGRGWLDFEGMFVQAGWDVEYEKPGYNEPGSACFIFSR